MASRDESKVDGCYGHKNIGDLTSVSGHHVTWVNGSTDTTRGASGDATAGGRGLYRHGGVACTDMGVWTASETTSTTVTTHHGGHGMRDGGCVNHTLPVPDRPRAAGRRGSKSSMTNQSINSKQTNKGNREGLFEGINS